MLIKVQPELHTVFKPRAGLLLNGKEHRQLRGKIPLGIFLLRGEKKIAICLLRATFIHNVRQKLFHFLQRQLPLFFSN